MRRPLSGSSPVLVITTSPPAPSAPLGTPAQYQEDVMNEPDGTNGIVGAPSAVNCGSARTGSRPNWVPRPTSPARTTSTATARLAVTAAPLRRSRQRRPPSRARCAPPPASRSVASTPAGTSDRRMSTGSSTRVASVSSAAPSCPSPSWSTESSTRSSIWRTGPAKPRRPPRAPPCRRGARTPSATARTISQPSACAASCSAREAGSS